MTPYISKQARVYFREKGTDAGNVHRACIKRYGVIPSAATRAVNQAAQQQINSTTVKQFHFKVFDLARQIDARMREGGRLEEADALRRVQQLEERYKWLDYIYQPERQNRLKVLILLMCLCLVGWLIQTVLTTPH